MSQATSYASWLAAAEELDALTGGDTWRDEPGSRHFHADLIQGQLDQMRDFREQGRVLELVDFLHASLHRNLGDIGAPELYQTAFGGTKRLITDYLDETERTLLWLCDTPFPSVPTQAKLDNFRLAARTFGRSALMLSGGATLGFYHLGVVKALWEEGLLPEVISGASTGAMIAAGICARTDDEIGELFGDIASMRRDGLKPLSLSRAWRHRSLLDPSQLLAVLRDNVGEYTFEEAWRRTGRVLNIAVSPTRTRQKPRLLCYLTSPDVLVISGALASSAVPGLFPPVVLQRRDATGALQPYIETERWIDGSFRHDLPMMRLSRLHNVNHFIVSQTNPHVLPFLAQRSRGGLFPFAVGLFSSTARVQAAHALEVARRVTGGSPLRPILDHAHALADQDYGGDIDLHPRFRPRAYLRVVANPTLDELQTFILEGQRATWPRIAMIQDHTRVSRLLSRCVKTLEQRLKRPPAPGTEPLPLRPE